jgi:hypothetical protein
VAFIFAASILFGAILAMRCRFWVLIPAMLIIGAALLVTIPVRHDPFAALLNFVSAVVGLQLGYLAAVIARSVENGASSEAPRSNSTPPTLPANVATFRIRGTRHAP